MSKGLGRVELAILKELRVAGSHSIGSLSIAVMGGKGLVLELLTSAPAWQSTARAVRSLIKKGLIYRVEGSKTLIKLLNT